MAAAGTVDPVEEEESAAPDDDDAKEVEAVAAENDATGTEEDGVADDADDAADDADEEEEEREAEAPFLTARFRRDSGSALCSTPFCRIDLEFSESTRLHSSKNKLSL